MAWLIGIAAMAAMIYLMLRQAAEVVNHKRVECLYTEARLQMKRRKRKKVPIADRQPLGCPRAANQVWSTDFVFDRTAEGRVIKSLIVVDDVTHEAFAIVPERAIGGYSVTRIQDRLAMSRGLPKAIRPDNGNQNAYIESFNGRFCDECLNEHWFTSLPHAKVVIESWRREYNEKRPKKELGGLTSSAYVEQLASKAVTLTQDSKASCY